MKISEMVELQDNYSPVKIDRELDRRVDAYITVVRSNHSVLQEEYPSAASIRSLGDQWIKGIDSGAIRPIVPAFHGESLMDGPKGEAIRASLNAAAMLSRQAKIALDSKRYEVAVGDAERALRILEMVRYGSAETLVVSASYLIRPYAILEASEGHINATRLQQLKNSVVASKSDPRVIDMLNRGKLLKSQYAVRFGDQQTDLDEMMDLGLLRGEIQNSRTAKIFGDFAGVYRAQKFASVAKRIDQSKAVKREPNVRHSVVNVEHFAGDSPVIAAR